MRSSRGKEFHKHSFECYSGETKDYGKHPPLIGFALMIWVVEKKVFQLVFDLGFERVKIPVRVKLEFEIQKYFQEHGFIKEE